ncbi:MAG: hypothetical protein ACNS62_03970 [Candidatus Cyclobacteriaceae bacterium M3_2C_046]
MYLLVTFLLCFNTFDVTYEDKISTSNWELGKVILVNGEQLSGRLNYDFKSEVVKLESDGRIRAFSPVKVSHFIFFDKQYQMLRKFYAVASQNKFNYDILEFYELIYQGSLTFFSKPHPKSDGGADRVLFEEYIFLEEDTEWSIKDQFYIWQDQQLAEYDGSVDEFLNLVELEFHDKIKDFIQHNRFDLEFRQDLKEVCLFYENLQEQIISKIENP